MYHVDWSLRTRRRYVTVMFRTKAEEAQWRPVIDALVKLDAAEDAIGEVCALMYGGPAWLFHPPSGAIELYAPQGVIQDSDGVNYDWAIRNPEPPVRRYDGTAGQQAEAAGAAEPAR